MLSSDFSFIIDECEQDMYDELWERAKLLAEVASEFTPIGPDEKQWGDRLAGNWEYNVERVNDTNEYVVTLSNIKPYALFIEYVGKNSKGYFIMHKAFFRLFGVVPKIKRLGGDGADEFTSLSIDEIKGMLS